MPAIDWRDLNTASRVYCRLVEDRYEIPFFSMCITVSVLLGCPCCSTVDETQDNVARGPGGRTKKDKNHWTVGRMGDIDFVGPTKMRGKVRQEVITRSIHSSLEKSPH